MEKTRELNKIHIEKGTDYGKMRGDAEKSILLRKIVWKNAKKAKYPYL